MQNNTANQGQTLNNNEIDNKDKEFLEKLKRDIENIKNDTCMLENEKEKKLVIVLIVYQKFYQKMQN